MAALTKVLKMKTFIFENKSHMKHNNKAKKVDTDCDIKDDAQVN